MEATEATEATPPSVGGDRGRSRSPQPGPSTEPESRARVSLPIGACDNCDHRGRVISLDFDRRVARCNGQFCRLCNSLLGAVQQVGFLGSELPRQEYEEAIRAVRRLQDIVASIQTASSTESPEPAVPPEDTA